MPGGSDQLDLDVAALHAACMRLGARMVVLFGSHATGEPPPVTDSDVDVAMSYANGTPAPSVWDAHRELAPIFGDRTLELVFLREAGPLFRWEIMREGRLLWGDPMAFLNYRAFAFRDFVDSADLRQLERTLFEKKMEFIRRRLHVAA